MISYAFRYAPIWLELQNIEKCLVEAETDPPSGHSMPFARVLEVGSGAEGLGLFWKGSLLGVDVHFKRQPLASGVQGSALHLPFAPRSFPVVVCCDMLEHLLPGERRAAVEEMLRVSRGRFLLGFPSGDSASQLYRELAQAFGKKQPPWLKEHLALGLPDAIEVEEWLMEAGWQVNVLWYESAALHKRLVWWERSGAQRWVSYLLARGLGRFMIAWIARMRLISSPDPMRVLLSAFQAD